jgi:hypothetical protein
MSAVNLKPLGSKQLTISNTAIPLSSGGAIPEGARWMMLRVTGNPVRFKVNSTPTASIGFPLAANDTLDWTDTGTNYTEMINTIEFIRSDASDAVLEIEFFGQR